MPASGSTLPRAPQRVFGQAGRRSTGWRVGRHPIAESALGWATRTDAEFDEVRADRKERCECLATRDFGGTDRDLALLARYTVEPILSRDFGRGVALDRPLTKVLVMTDADHRYATPADWRYQRKLLLDSLTINVPKDVLACR